MAENVTMYTASLYVGDLDVYVSEEILYEKFSQCGPVALVRICRDKVTKQSLGYAYVNYFQANDAERALDTLNFDVLNGRPMRLMWCQRDPALRKSGVGNVFIKNLHESIDNKELYDTFSEFGNIISCKIMFDENSKSKGYGFVHYVSEESAEKAIAAANDKLIRGKKVFVGKFISKYIRATETGDNMKKFNNVYVKNFGQDFNDDMLRELFAKFGEIKSVKVELKPSGESAGFGYVEFIDAESALKAVQEMNNYDLNDKKLVVSKFEKKAERLLYLKKLFEERKIELMKKTAKSNIYVKNLDEKIDNTRLRAEFSKHGTITSAVVMLDENQNSKGFGFVCFTSGDEAQRAIEDMNGRMLGTKPLYVCIAQRKEERKKILTAKLKERFQANQFVANTPYMQYQNQFQTYPSAVPRWQQNKVVFTQQQQQNIGQQRFYNQNRFNTPRGSFNNPNFYPQQVPSNRYPINRPIQAQAQQFYNEQVSFVAQLSSMEPQQRLNLIGDHLYAKIANLSSENPSKITGMFLEGIEISELILMLENETYLIQRIREAEQLLNTHREKVAYYQQTQPKSVPDQTL